jgi:hypothetical protein
MLYYLSKAKVIIRLHCSSNSAPHYINAFYVYSAECQHFYGDYELYSEMSDGQIKKTVISLIKFSRRFFLS